MAAAAAAYSRASAASASRVFSARCASVARRKASARLIARSPRARSAAKRIFSRCYIRFNRSSFFFVFSSVESCSSLESVASGVIFV